jgi:hypothetical protein
MGSGEFFPRPFFIVGPNVDRAEAAVVAGLASDGGMDQPAWNMAFMRVCSDRVSKPTVRVS